MGGGKKCPACEPPGLLPCKKANWLLYGRLGEGWQEGEGGFEHHNWWNVTQYVLTGGSPSLLRCIYCA